METGEKPKKKPKKKLKKKLEKKGMGVLKRKKKQMKKKQAAEEEATQLQNKASARPPWKRLRFKGPISSEGQAAKQIKAPGAGQGMGRPPDSGDLSISGNPVRTVQGPGTH